MMSAATIDPEARYLDHERVIRELEDAERDHKLDAAGVVERLKEACDTCQAAADRYAVRAVQFQQGRDAYIIAQGKYLAEIKRRVALPPSNARSSLKTQERPGWGNWCRSNGFSNNRADAYIAAGKGDMARITKERDKNRERSARRRSRSTLEKIKDLWMKVTPVEREEFIRWALSGKDYAPPDKAVGKTGSYQEHGYQVAL